MANHRTDADADALAQRKAQLVAQGAVYRSEIRGAERSVAADLNLGKLVRSVLGHAALMLYAAFKRRTETAGATLQTLQTLQTLLPLVVGGVSALSRRSLLKPALRLALLMGTVALLAKGKAARVQHRASD